MKHFRTFAELSDQTKYCGFPKNRMVQLSFPRTIWVTILILLLATIVTRLPWFGDASYHEDESYYLVFAKAMHQGAIPYVDIWDRKPLGLFLIYWAITFIPGTGIEAYQFVAGLFAFLTAFTISRIVLHFSTAGPACCAGVAYLAFLPMLLGAGGQSPVFYNLLIALAVLLLLPLIEGRSDFNKAIRGACISMALCGFAITVKPTAIVESVFLGIVAAYHVLKDYNTPLILRLQRVAILVALGAAPTLVIFIYFAIIGEFDTYWFASVISVGMKKPQAVEVTINAIIYLTIILFPLLLMSFIGIWQLVQGEQKGVVRFISFWMLAAFGGFLLIPNFWDHYALPLISPLVILATGIFARQGTGIIWLLSLLYWTVLVTGWPDRSGVSERREDVDRLAQVVNDARNGGCFYLFEGPPVLYALTDACHVTSRLFPQHLSFALERSAIGVAPSDEMHQILSRRPSVIALSNEPLVRPHNEATRAILTQGLRRHYRMVALLPVREINRPTYKMEVWALRK